MKVCSVDGCVRPNLARGYCEKHYARWRRGKDPAIPTRRELGPPPCAIEGCAKMATSKGYCPRHYARLLRHGDPTYLMPRNTLRGARCSVDGCGRLAISLVHGMCMTHYARQIKGQPLDAPVGSLSHRSYPPPQSVPCACGELSYAKGLCRACYQRHRRQEQRKGRS